MATLSLTRMAERGLNDALGGTWSLVVSPTGAFTGKLRLGSNSSATVASTATAQAELSGFDYEDGNFP